MSRGRTILLRLGLLAALAFAAARLLAPAAFDLDAGRVVLQVRPALPGGSLALSLGPLGELSWRTHRAPLAVAAEIFPGRGADEPPDVGQLEHLWLDLVLAKAPWLALTGLLVAALVIEGSRRRRLVSMGAGAGTALLTGTLLVGLSVLTFDAGGFDHPRYRGPIEDAPRVLRLIKEMSRDWEGVRRNIGALAAGVERVHSQMAAAGPQAPAGDTVRLLLIADIHNNPLGLVITKRLAAEFSVDAVLDAGDFTDRGTKPEGELFARFGRLGVPHVIVAGNHEDTDTMERVARMPGAVLLESGRNDVARFRGVTIVGESDPNAYSIDSNPDNALAREQIPLMCERLASRAAELSADVVLVHDPKLGRCAADRAERDERSLVFAWGHMHRPAYEERGSVISVSPGTSGSNGVKSRRNTPYGFSLLELDATTRRVVSVCQFLLDGPSALRQASCHMPRARPAPAIAGR